MSTLQIDEDVWYDDPAGEDLPEPYKTIDDLIWTAFDNAWDSIEARSAARSKQLPVPVNSGKASRQIKGVVQFSCPLSLESNVVVCALSNGSIVVFSENNAENRQVLEPPQASWECKSIDVTDVEGKSIYLVAAVQSDGIIKIYVCDTAKESAKSAVYTLDELHSMPNGDSRSSSTRNTPTRGAISPDGSEANESSPLIVRFVLAHKKLCLVVLDLNSIRIFEINGSILCECLSPESMSGSVSIEVGGDDGSSTSTHAANLRVSLKHTSFKGLLASDAHDCKASFLSIISTDSESRVYFTCRDSFNVTLFCDKVDTIDTTESSLSKWPHTEPIVSMEDNRRSHVAVGLVSGTVVIWNALTELQERAVHIGSEPVDALGFANFDKETVLIFGCNGALPAVVTCYSGIFCDRSDLRVPLDCVPTGVQSENPTGKPFEGTKLIAASGHYAVVTSFDSNSIYYIVDCRNGKPAGLVQSDSITNASSMYLKGTSMFVKGSSNEDDLVLSILTLDVPKVNEVVEPRDHSKELPKLKFFKF